MSHFVKGGPSLPCGDQVKARESGSVDCATWSSRSCVGTASNRPREACVGVTGRSWLGLRRCLYRVKQRLVAKEWSIMTGVFLRQPLEEASGAMALQPRASG